MNATPTPERKRRNPTSTEVQEIRAGYATGVISQAQLGEQFGLSRVSIWKIIHGKTRATAGGPIIALSRRANSKLTEESVRSIRSEFAQGGITRAELAANHGGVSTAAIAAVVCRQNWKHVTEVTPEDATISWFQSSCLKSVDPSHVLSATDAMLIFGFRGGLTT